MEEMTRRLLAGQSPDEPLLQLALEAAAQEIRSYCNLSEVPSALYPVGAEMAAALYERYQDGVGRTVVNLSRGDYTVRFAEEKAGVLAAFYPRLRAFRRLHR